VVLVSENGQSELPASFRYTAQQSLTTILPPRGSSRGGTPVILMGTGFGAHGEATVFFGSEPAHDVVVLDEERISLRTPPGPASRTAEVRLRFDGIEVGALTYTYDPSPRDLDGDGIDDRAFSVAGEIHVHFGASPSSPDRRLRLRGSAGRPLAGSFQVGDLDADGRNDLVLASPDDGRVVVLVGPFTQEERSIETGRSVLPPAPAGARRGAALRLGDHDLDGELELLVGSPGTNQALLVEPVESGAPPLVIEETILDHDFGATIDTVDVDADGDLDVFIGAPHSSRGGPSAGAVFGYEARQARHERRVGRPRLELRWEWFGDQPGARFGSRFSLGHYTGPSARWDLAVLTSEPGAERILVFSDAAFDSTPIPATLHEATNTQLLGRWEAPGGELLWLDGEGHGRLLDLRSGEVREATQAESEGARWQARVAPASRP